MARYKPVDTQPEFVAIDLAAQLLPGTFEHALHHLLEQAIDLTPFDARYRNDTTGAPAYAPGMLLRVVLFAYSRGIISSRAIARACEEQVTFIALSGDSRPHFTTIAHFVSTLGDQIAPIFAAVLAVCDRQGLIGREMFAIDGVKLPSNASKHRSGTRADFERQATKMERAADAMLARHRAEDARDVEPSLAAKDAVRRERLVRDAAELRTWLTQHPTDRRGARGAVRKSNRTDNESAKMATSKGVIQGYTGVATVDAAHQIIVDAQAHGVGAEQELLLGVIAATAPLRTIDTLITADAGYHSEANLCALAEAEVPALIADGNMRKRDTRFATQERYTTLPNPLHDKSRPMKKTAVVFGPEDFRYDPVARTCICPAGKSLNRRGAANVTGGHVGEHFQGAPRDCGPCPLRAQCLRTPGTTPVRNVAFFRDRVGRDVNYSALMRDRIDAPTGRAQYARRFATVEPVFANLRANKRLDRFTLRGRAKVDTQWKLYCLVHNIEKLANNGYAA
ncbi:MAG: transposase [Gemmatimonas sp.]|jgi:transposase|uniref:transposase n=1 Tax=Gemmatimonas sp. TaxID=1962908 RepID=UPI0022BB1B14|nr:transposase [Gemmatimonas sp.]MCZ8014047.1 transposase [Gemmatimonas sp.]MCZ8268747.1 transposase [Gemmatimonas sp.]